MRQYLLVALAALPAAAVLVAAQAPPPAAQSPTFKTQVEYVEVDALVLDKQGNLVRNLKKEDFDIREDGKTQSIVTFSLVDIPVDRLEQPLFTINNRTIEPDVRTNERPFDGRIYVLLLDDLQTDFTRTPRVRALARQFIERRLGANDLMAVVTVGGRTDTTQEFTSSKRLLLAAVDRFSGRKLVSSTIARSQQYYRQAGTGVGGNIDDPEEFERLQNAERTLRQLKDVAEWFGGVHGRRKTILFISEGIDYDTTDVVPGLDSTHQGASSVMDDTREAIGAAQRANVAIYGIDPRGLATGMEDTVEVGAFADQDNFSASIDSTTGRPNNNIGQQQLLDEQRNQRDSLRQLSDETGGVAMVNRNTFDAAFDRIVADNSSYYVLAYYPPSDKRDGKFHKIQVTVKGHPELTVRARQGYLAPRGKAPAPPKTTNGSSLEVHEALTSPLPVSGLTMNVFAAAFKGAQPNASVLFGAELRGRDLNLGDGDVLELSSVANDAEGKIRGGHLDKLTVRFRPDTKTLVEQGGLRVLNRLDLPPGRYQLRLATHDTAGGNVGSVIYDLEVPDFYKEPFSMSGLVLTSLSTAGMVTARADAQLKEVLPAPPTASRNFPQHDELALFAEVYDNSASTPHKVDLVSTVTSNTGTVVFKNEEERDSSELQGKTGGYGLATRVPLGDAPPGLYLLTVEARSRLGKGAVASREILFRVMPAR